MWTNLNHIFSLYKLIDVINIESFFTDVTVSVFKNDLFLVYDVSQEKLLCLDLKGLNTEQKMSLQAGVK